MKKTASRIGILLFICALFVPTFAFASANSTPAVSSSLLSQILSIFNLSSNSKTTVVTTQQSNTSSYSGYTNEKDWWDSFCKWWNNDGYHYGGDKDDWGNKDGCLSSDEIWKKWYCN